MLITDEVLKFDRSNNIKELQIQNILDLILAQEVLKFEKFNDIKEFQ